MAYKTSQILTPNRLRRAAGEQMTTLSDPTYAIVKHSLVGIINGKVVPAEHFTAATYTDEAGARAAFKTNCFGIASVGTSVGEEKPIVCYWKGELELEIDAGSFMPGVDYTSLAWDSGNGNLMSQKWKAETAAPYLGRITKRSPMPDGEFGATTTTIVAAYVDVALFRSQ